MPEKIESKKPTPQKTNLKGKQSEQFVHVVVAIVQNADGKFLIAKRTSKQHLGGLWEFPGGKVENGENTFSALQRELKEEVDIHISSSRSFLQIRHCYPDKSIFLDIYKVSDFSGQARGREGQEIQWADLKEFDNFDFPEANLKIIKALKVPEIVSICSAEFNGQFCLSENIVSKLKNIFELNVDTILLRLPLLSDIEYKESYEFISETLKMLSPKKQIKLLSNRPHLVADLKNCAGLHLSSKELMQCHSRPVSSEFLLSASCHNQTEVTQAEKIACDFIFVSPVFDTNSHQNAVPLLWMGLQELTESTQLPVLALGGMNIKHLLEAKRNGAFGVSGITNFGMDK